jgi:hypothetical protein
MPVIESATSTRKTDLPISPTKKSWQRASRYIHTTGINQLRILSSLFLAFFHLSIRDDYATVERKTGQGSYLLARESCHVIDHAVSFVLMSNVVCQ